MKIITEQEAQNLADALGCTVTVDADDEVYLWYDDVPIQGRESWILFGAGTATSYDNVSFRIKSTRTWGEKIWRGSI